MPSQGNSPGPTLLDLPLEIQYRIFSLLVASSFQPSHSLLYVNKRLYELFLPFSVHTYSNGAPKVYGKDARPRSRCMQFLRYITILKPDLARHVRYITVGDFDADKPEGFEEVGPRSDEADTYRGYIEAAFPEGDDDWEEARSEWLQDLREGTEDAEIALLLLVCTHLTTLNMGEPYKPPLFHRVLKLARSPSNRDISRIRPLSRLEDIYCESLDTKYGYLSFPEMVPYFLELPRLRSYECILANGPDATAILSLPRRSSTVDNIVLRKSSVTGETFKALTGACKSLRSVEYLRGLYHMYELEMMPRDFLEGLLPHCETLENIHVDFEEEWDKPGWTEYPHRLYVGTELRQFSQLKRLVIGSQALTGILDNPPDPFGDERMPAYVPGAPRIIECIPESLEYLEIHQCGTEILSQIQEFLDLLNDDTRFPHLTHIRLQIKAATVAKGVNLCCNRPSTILEIICQTEANRTFDLITCIRKDSKYIINICTRIYDADIREVWLKHRGLDRGKADVNLGVLEIREE